MEERNRRDLEELKSQSMKEKLKRLEEKAERFHAMQRGANRMCLLVVGDIDVDDANTLVDFKRRKEMYDFYQEELPESNQKPNDPVNPMDLAKDRYKEMMDAPHKDNEVLIEDEFGRLRWVPRGSDDHMNFIGSSYRIRQLLEGKEEEKNPERKIQTSRRGY